MFYTNWEKDRPDNEYRIVDKQELSEDQGIILRTRTKVDANGTLVSAHYSKIYGQFDIDGQFPKSLKINNGGITTFFNPVENDTNLECDGKWHRELRKGKRKNEDCGNSGAL